MPYIVLKTDIDNKYFIEVLQVEPLEISIEDGSYFTPLDEEDIPTYEINKYLLHAKSDEDAHEKLRGVIDRIETGDHEWRWELEKEEDGAIKEIELLKTQEFTENSHRHKENIFTMTQVKDSNLNKERSIANNRYQRIRVMTIKLHEFKEEYRRYKQQTNADIAQLRKEIASIKNKNQSLSDGLANVESAYENSRNKTKQLEEKLAELDKTLDDEVTYWEKELSIAEDQYQYVDSEVGAVKELVEEATEKFDTDIEGIEELQGKFDELEDQQRTLENQCDDFSEKLDVCTRNINALFDTDKKNHKWAVYIHETVKTHKEEIATYKEKIAKLEEENKATAQKAEAATASVRYTMLIVLIFIIFAVFGLSR